MTDKYQALREAAEKATPGPWDLVASGDWEIEAPDMFGPVASIQDDDNAAYIAAASPDVIASLLSDLDAANALADRAALSTNLLAGDLAEMARACGIRDDEYPRKAIEREIRTLRERAEKAERERDELSSRLECEQYENVALRDRAEKAERERDELKKAYDSAARQRAELRKALRKSQASTAALESEVARLREMVPSIRVRSAILTMRGMTLPKHVLLPSERDAVDIVEQWVDTLDVTRLDVTRLDAARGGAK